jgi:hypothetical protein
MLSNEIDRGFIMEMAANPTIDPIAYPTMVMIKPI